MRVWSPGLVAIIVALVLPSAGEAAIRKVEPTGSDSSDCTVTPCKTVQYAADQADPGDTVQIGNATFTETVATDKVLTFEGGGTPGGVPGTTIQGPDGSSSAGSPAFVLPNGGTLRSLVAAGGDGADVPLGSGYDGGVGVLFKAEEGATLVIEDSRALGGSGGAGFPFQANGADALLMEDQLGKSALSAVRSFFESGAGFVTGGVRITGPGAHAEFVQCSIEGFGTHLLGSPGLWIDGGAQANAELTGQIGSPGAAVTGGSLSVNRSFVTSDLFPAAAVEASPTKPASTLIASDTIFYSNEAEAAVVSDIGGDSASLIARGTTLLSVTGGGGAVVANGSAAKVTMRNSIARQEPKGEDKPTDIRVNGGTIDAAYSNYSTLIRENGGSAPEPGEGTNVAGNPQLRQPQPVGTIRLEPLETSPVIDRGDPGLVSAGEIDYLGAPRSLDGNHDCIAAPDLGALELTGQSSPCPPPKVANAVPVVSGFAITNKRFAPKGASMPGAKSSAKGPRKGTKFIYSLSEPAKVAILIERRKRGAGRAKFAKATTLSAQQQSGKRSMPFSGVVRGKPLKPGRYRATITATDSAGQASTAHRLSFQIVGGPS